MQILMKIIYGVHSTQSHRYPAAHQIYLKAEPWRHLHSNPGLFETIQEVETLPHLFHQPHEVL